MECIKAERTVVGNGFGRRQGVYKLADGFYLRITDTFRTASQLLKSKIGYDFSLTVASNFVVVILGSAGGVLAARLLGPEGRGELAAAIVWAAVLTALVSLGIPQAITYYVAGTSDQVGSIFAAILRIWFVQSILALGIGWIAAREILGRFQPDAVGPTSIYLFSIPSSMLITYMSTTAQGLKLFSLFNLLRITSSATYVGSVGVAIVTGQHHAQDVVSLLLGVQMALAVVAFVWFRFRVGLRLKYERIWSDRLVRYGLKSFGGDISWLANNRLDQFIMSAFMNLKDLGHYAVAVSYATVLFPLSGAFAMILFPEIAGTRRTSVKQRIIWQVFRLNLIVSGTGATILAVLSPLGIPFLFGQEFQAATVPAAILLIGTVLLGSIYVLSDSVRGLGYPLAHSIAETIGLVITGVGLYLFLPRFGIIGAAWVSDASYAAVAIALFITLSYLLHTQIKLETEFESSH